MLYIHEDTVWTTVHITKERDLKKIEKQIIAKDYNDFSITQEDFLQLREA